MRRTNTVALAPSISQHQRLLEIADSCAQLWNEITYRRRQSLFAGKISWDWNDLYDKYKSTLGASTAQQIERKNSESWRSYFALLKLRKKEKFPNHIKKIRPPGYWKDRRSGKRKLVILIRCDCYSFEGNKLKIPKKLHLKWQGRPRWRNWKRQGLLTILYDELKKKWYVRQPVEVKPQHQPLSNQRAYIDIGVLNLLTVLVDNDRQTIAYSGRSALADWWYLSHRINKLKSMAKRINNQESTKQIRSLYRRRRLRFRQYVNTTIRRVVFDLYKRGVSKIITGNLTGILNGKGTKKGNTMTHNFWSHYYVTQRLSEVAEEYGLVLKFVDERGTSSKCIRCDSRRITRRERLVKCLECG